MIWFCFQVLQEESQNMRSRSLSGSVGGHGELSSPDSCSSSASTTKSSSHASTSNTDSAESGIDVHMPLEITSSDTDQISKSKDKKCVTTDNHDPCNGSGPGSPDQVSSRQFAVAEVHRAMEPEQIELEDLGYSNQAFEGKEPVMAC